MDEIKQCIKCKRELPKTIQYFPYDKMCKTGLLNVCRECNPKYGRFLKDGEEPRKRWTYDDIELLKSVYKDYTGEEIINKYFPDRTIRSIESIASKYHLNGKSEETIKRSKEIMAIKVGQELKGKPFTEEHKKNISISKVEYFKTHEVDDHIYNPSDKTRQKMSEIRKKKGIWKGDTNPRHIKPLNGKLNGNWNGGANELYQELRSEIKDWKLNSMELSNYKCVITNERFDNIHHLKQFTEIENEALKLCNLELKEHVCDYSNSDFIKLKNTVIRLHNLYGLGVCLCKPIHKLFHDTYGYFHTTKEQFLEFVDRLNDHEFDDFLNDNKLILNINYDAINKLI